MLTRAKEIVANYGRERKPKIHFFGEEGFNHQKIGEIGFRTISAKGEFLAEFSPSSLSRPARSVPSLSLNTTEKA
jgi:hypothetical protein